MENRGGASSRRRGGKARLSSTARLSLLFLVVVSPCRRECAGTRPRRSCRRRSCPRLPNAPVVPSTLNPDAAPFTGVSGEAPFGAKTEVYFPFRDYTVEEWLDWIYHLQTNHVLLTPEYAAYVCEVARLLGMPSTEHEDPQSIHVCCMGPGSYLVKWFVDSRKLPSNDKQVIPPGFDLYHHGAGQLLTFLIGAFPKNWGTANPDANFKNSDGRGVFQLKCDTQPKDRSCLPCRFGFSVSNGEMRTASGHFTLNNCVVELPEEESAFHLFGGAGPDQLVEVNALVELF